MRLIKCQVLWILLPVSAENCIDVDACSPQLHGLELLFHKGAGLLSVVG